MSLYNNNNSENDEVLAVITWNTTRKRSVYNPTDLPNLRTSSGRGDGFKYFNNFTNSYERPRSLIVVLRNKLQALTLETRSASLSSSSSPKNNNNNPNRKLPAHLRHHQYLNGGNGYSVSI